MSYSLISSFTEIQRKAWRSHLPYGDIMKQAFLWHQSLCFPHFTRCLINCEKCLSVTQYIVILFKMTAYLQTCVLFINKKIKTIVLWTMHNLQVIQTENNLKLYNYEFVNLVISLKINCRTDYVFLWLSNFAWCCYSSYSRSNCLKLLKKPQTTDFEHFGTQIT